MSPGTVPTALLLMGGAGAVIATAAALSGRAARHPDLPVERWSAPLPPVLVRVIDARATRVLLGGIGLAATVAGIVALARRDAPTDGLIAIPVIAAVSLLAGPVYRLVNPVRMLAGMRAGMPGDRVVSDVRAPGDRAAFDVRDAALWLVVLSVIALSTRDARVLAATVGVFVLAQAVLARGGRSDPFETLATLLGNLAPVERGARRQLLWRNPLVAVSHAVLPPGAVAFGAVVVAASLTHAAWRHPAWRSTFGFLGGAAPAVLLGLALAVVAGALRVGIIRPFMRSATVPLVAAYGVVAGGPWWPPVDLAAFVGLHVVAVAVLHRQAIARHDLRTARAVQFPLRVVLVASVIGGLALLAGR
jgi:hypothetical protein